MENNIEMELTSLISTLIGKIFEFVASTNFGQFCIKKIDSLLWTLEKPAVYCVDGVDSDANQQLSWPVFWTVLINIQIFRVVISKILVQFNGNPVESKDIVKNLKKWRRSLRSLRFRGLRKMREAVNENGNSTSPPMKQSSKKRNHEEMLDHNLLEDLMNRTFSTSDDSDFSFTISQSGDTFMNCSSIGQSFSDDNQSPLNDINLPNASPIKSGQQEPNGSSQSIGFESTVNESAFIMSREDSTSFNSSPVRETRAKFESNDNRSDQCGSMESGLGSSKRSIGKESLMEPNDAADFVISKFVQIHGKTNFSANTKFQQGNKNNSKSHNDVKLVGVCKRKTTARSSHDNLTSQHHSKDTKGQKI